MRMLSVTSVLLLGLSAITLTIDGRLVELGIAAILLLAALSQERK